MSRSSFAVARVRAGDNAQPGERSRLREPRAQGTVRIATARAARLREKERETVTLSFLP